MLDLLAILLCGVFDRKGGDDNLGFRKNVDRFISGSCVGYLIGLRDAVQIITMGVCYALAMAVAYGGPWGGALRGESGSLQGLLVRGIKGALILFPMCYWVDIYSPMIAIILGFVISPYLSRYIFDSDMSQMIRESRMYERWNIGRKEKWNLAELIRGWIVGAVCAAL